VTANQPDRLDRIEVAIENLTNTIVASNARIDKSEAAFNAKMEKSEAAFNAKMEKSEATFNARMEKSEAASNARMDRLEATLETFSEPIQVLLEASQQHDAIIASNNAMISRLDAIIERMVYREGRGNDEQ